MSERLFGASVRRREDARLVTGRGRYVADVALPGMLHVAVHRSSHAHARIARIEAGEARRRPGVVHVLVPADVATLPRMPLLPHPSLSAPVCPEILPQEIVSYVGQPLALVVAESPDQAADALDALRVAYEPLPVVASLDDALRPDGPRVHPGGNVVSRFTQHVGDPAGALARAEIVLRERFRLHRGAGMAMETRAITARWDADLGQVTVWSTTQAPQILRRMLARYLGLPEHAVRVLTQDIGGGFGPKAIVYSEDILVPLLARTLGRPVRFVETRREHLLAVTQERDQWHDVELGLTREGRIVALRDAFVHDCGAFVSWGIIVPLITSVSVPGPYRVPNYEVTFTAVYTNRVPVTPVRGAGRPQAVFVMERMLDLAAERLGLDRVAIRERNLIQPHEFPYDVGLISRDNSPRRYDSGNYPECLRRVAEAVGWDGFAAERERARAEGRAIGLGFALYVEDTGLGPYEGIRVRVDPLGHVFVFSGASSQGQAHETTLAQIVADGLSVPIEQVTVVPGDTAGIPYGVGTFASRVAVLASASAVHAAAEVRKKALAVAADHLEAAPEDLTLEDGRIAVRGAPGRGLALGEVAAIARMRKHELAEEHRPAAPTFTGLFLILVAKAPAPVWEVTTNRRGVPHLTRKKPWPYVNHYHFHVIDPEWGHLTLKVSGHPPFGVQVMLNGHEWVERAARDQAIAAVKEGNCFVGGSDFPAVDRLAAAVGEERAIGRITDVCERWVYSTCLCFALDREEQERSGFRYQYSGFQIEYSRNLVFARGTELEAVDQGFLDRTRRALDVPTLKTISAGSIARMAPAGRGPPLRASSASWTPRTMT